jgi:hypothetical protein
LVNLKKKSIVRSGLASLPSSFVFFHQISTHIFQPNLHLHCHATIHPWQRGRCLWAIGHRHLSLVNLHLPLPLPPLSMVARNHDKLPHIHHFPPSSDSIIATTIVKLSSKTNSSPSLVHGDDDESELPHLRRIPRGFTRANATKSTTLHQKSLRQPVGEGGTWQ